MWNLFTFLIHKTDLHSEKTVLLLKEFFSSLSENRNRKLWSQFTWEEPLRMFVIYFSITLQQCFRNLLGAVCQHRVVSLMLLPFLQWLSSWIFTNESGVLQCSQWISEMPMGFLVLFFWIFRTTGLPRSFRWG